MIGDPSITKPPINNQINIDQDKSNTREHNQTTSKESCKQNRTEKFSKLTNQQR